MQYAIPFHQLTPYPGAYAPSGRGQDSVWQHFDLEVAESVLMEVAKEARPDYEDFRRSGPSPQQTPRAKSWW